MSRCAQCGPGYSRGAEGCRHTRSGKTFENALRAAFFAGRDSITAPKSAIDYNTELVEKKFKRFLTAWSGLPDPIEESREKVRHILGSEEETAALNRYEKSMGL